MKFVLKNPVENDSKPYVLRVNDFLREPLSALPEFDPLALEVMPLSNYQKDLLNAFGRTFWIVSYLPPSVLRFVLDRLEECDGLEKWAFCTHDRDTDKNGLSKKAHTHLLLYFSERVSLSFIAFWFRSFDLKIVSQTDISKQWNYLIHDSVTCEKQHKFKYDISERFTNDETYWKNRCLSTADGSENDYYVNLIKDFYQLNRLDLIRKYGYLVIRDYRNLRDIADTVRFEEELENRLKGLHPVEGDENNIVDEGLL